MTVHITLLYTVSTDGFIATKDDQTPWLAASWDEYLTTCRTFRHLVMGRKTFELFRADPSINPADFASITVLSHNRLHSQSWVSFVTSPQDAIAHLHRNNVTTALLLGGSQTATSFLDTRLISEIHLDRNPVLLGDGIRMFQPMREPPFLRLKSSVCGLDGRVQEVYQVLSPS